MAGRGRGGIHGGYISGLGPLGSAGLLGSGGMASRPGSGGLLGDGGRGDLPVIGGAEGQVSHGRGGPPRAPSPELRPKPGLGVPTMVECGKTCGGCYPVITCCLNFFCCCWRGPMGLQGRPGPMGPPGL